MSSDKISAIMILEILGRPAEHLVETLENIIGQMGEEKGVKVINKKIKEPVELKDNKGFFSSFVEVEVETDSINHIVMLMFKYTPANIQIIEPEKVVIDHSLLSETLSEIIRKIHGYDEVARVIQMQNQQLKQQVAEFIQKHNIKPEDLKKEISKKKKKSSKK